MILALLAAWPAVALAVGVLVGRCIRRADDEQPTQRDMGLAA